ncbi:endolytic transglycosylase MltG [Aestuariivirga sp.]|uniref:endolytic transglycosylase MltG n=1 Tax=Aestuariivirga sp. TaxID=2650926 RepID=UPI00391CAC3A
MKVPEPRLPRKRASAVSRVLRWTFLIVLLLGIAGAAAAFYAQAQFTAPGPLAEDKVFIVEQGLSTPAIGAALEENGIISNARLFAAMAYATGQRTRLKAGEYAFPKSASMQEVMALIASGRSIAYKISIPEGFTSEMAVARVNAHEVLAGPPAAVPPEGSILPDTYVFRRGMTRRKLVEDMQAAQAKLLEELWATRVPIPTITSKEQAVTLASIVEKETAVAEERPVIASVFINRLERGMRLQSDPTIIYGIAGGKGRLERGLTRTDIETETPYNTYRIDGLPPGPIANPGRAALEAVLDPQATDYLYFVADGTGGHAFATTLEEHNRNVRKWRQIAGNAAAAAAAEDAAQAAEGTAGEPAPAPAPATATEAPPQAPADAPLAAAVPEATPTPVPEAPAAATASPEPTAPPAAGPAPGTIVTVEGRQAVIPRLRPPR